MLVARSFGLDMSKPSASSYKDLKTSSWASPAAEALRAKGWMQGSGSAFLPNAPVTQEQMAVVLAKALDLTNSPIENGAAALSDAQLASASVWAQAALKQSAKAGLLEGYTQGIEPGRKVLRGEAASAVLAASNLQLQAIEAVQDGIVKIGGVAYQVSQDLAGLFTAANAPALAGAKVNLTITNGTVTAVRTLDLKSAGTAAAQGQPEFGGNVALNGGGAKISGAVTVSGDFVTLNALEIGGDLTIASSVQHDFSSTGLIVKGTTHVLGGDDHTVVFRAAQLESVVLNKEQVRVELLESSKLKEMFVQKSASLEGDSSVRIPKLMLEPGVGFFNLNAPVIMMQTDGRLSLTLGRFASINNLLVTSILNPMSFITNFGVVRNQISLWNNAPFSTALPSVPVPVTESVYTAPPVVVPPVVTPPVVNPPAEPVDLAGLRQALADAELALEELPVGDLVGQSYPQKSQLEFKEVLIRSQAVLDDADATQSAVNEAASTLVSATQALRDSKNHTQITRALDSATVQYAVYQVGTAPRQISQSTYDTFWNGLADLKVRNPDPAVIDPDTEYLLLNELSKLKLSLEAQIIAWDYEPLQETVAKAQSALIDHEGTLNSREPLQASIQASEDLLKLSQTEPWSIFQKTVNNRLDNLWKATEHHLDKNNKSLSSTVLSDPLSPAPSPETLSYNEETDVLEPLPSSSPAEPQSGTAQQTGSDSETSNESPSDEAAPTEAAE
ncbi:S-layer homology domain-containing protein [Saccharibacillus qingshengii]|uniref:S-layer homology domain-containing protein n=1 Tax=Saccharibacillus qingshengii TaxID=1763540 RepID=UPI0015559E47